MQNMRSIEIDFDVHKKIEIERLNFSETPNDVLRRLLKITVKESKYSQSLMGKPWSGKGVTLPHQTELRMEYNGTVYEGRITNGIWVVEGKDFNSPSAAASGIAVTKKGKTTNLDGWIYWRVKRPGDTAWTAIADLRPKLSDEEMEAILKDI
ncbi:hypothetical protein [Asticcacaulis endophyticus]|uniref:DUF2924 domain-containing protein n=1 Tax=Asticcacaulis endophyticus TaxID=1395890 RepID=A0A918QGB9_9CAUL|nr:hypothetical protein [Asticcacaulis endophyticus]GGZ44238.1 hypothetical protein GCM10011273_33720 [Asticcacaulis endophyticus]